ncbi:MAG: D-alanyl-D-alanine carboxypeptidase family protein [Anaerovoracaceae bacterium]
MSKNLQKKISNILIILLLLMCFTATGYAKSTGKETLPSLPKTSSRSVVVLNAKNGNILYSKDGDMTIYPASTGKVLTAIVAIENAKLDEVITVSANALKGQEKGGAHIALEAGEKITMKDALYGLLLASGNDCAIAIAEHISGSEKEFAKLMNKKADELNLINSHFVTSSGLYDKNHFSCAADLATITNYAIKNPDFLKIFGSLKHVIKPSNKDKEKKVLYNSHRMLKFKSYEYDGVIGGKRGYITESRFNLITYAKRGEIELICVTGKGDSQEDNLKDTTKLFDYYFDNYKSINIGNKINGKEISEILKTKGYLLSRSETNTDTITSLLPKNKDVSDLTFSFTAYTDVNYPISKGTIIGEITMLCDNKSISSVPLYAASDIMSPKASQFRLIIISSIILILLLILLFISVLYLRKSQRKKREIVNKRIQRRYNKHNSK